jgi:hypothetical protein
VGKKAKVPPLFKNNPGKSQVVFPEDAHPYFKALDGVNPSQLDSIKNYGMKGWKSIKNEMRDYAPPAPTPSTSGEFSAWWNSRAGKSGTFRLTDVKGTQITADELTKANIVGQSQSGIGTLLGDVVKNADEAWSFYEDEKLVQTYLKYYDTKVVTVIAQEHQEELRAISIYEIKNEKSFLAQRKGVLLHANKKF